MRDRMLGFCAVVATCLVGSQEARAQEVQVFFGNLHSHTSYSDGVSTPEEAYKHARDVARLDFIALTEHNHAEAGRIAQNPDLYGGANPISLLSTATRFTVPGKFVALYGQEFSSISSGNHANVFDVKDVIQTAEVPNGAWEKLLDRWIPAHLDSMGKPALVLLNHPDVQGSPDSKEYGRDDYRSVDAWRTALDARAELINLINGPSHDQQGPGRPAEEEFLRYLNLGFHVAPTADQDNHRANWGSGAETRTAVLATELSKAAIMEALRARRVYATQDRNLRLVPRIGGQLIGAQVTGASVPAVGSAIPISLMIEDDDEPSAAYQIDVFEDEIGGSDGANLLLSLPVSGNGAHALSGVRYAGGNRYLFLRVRQLQDDDVDPDTAWTAPVWFEPNGSNTGPGSAPGPLPEAELRLEVDLQAEEAVVMNLGTAPAELGGWKLVSVQGNQIFTFPSPFVLAPGATVTVTSGPQAVDNPPASLRWMDQPVWRNAGDPGELRDLGGNLVAKAP